MAALVAIGKTVGADADEAVRWYDSVQKLTWGYTVSNGVATISTPGFWDSNARDACKGDIVVPSRIGPDAYGLWQETVPGQDRFAEYRPAVTRYLRSSLAGYMRMEVGARGVTMRVYGGASAAPAHVWRLR